MSLSSAMRAAAHIVLPSKVIHVFSRYGLCSASPLAVFLRAAPSSIMELVVNSLQPRYGE
jgi:hypothetical protein